MAIEVVMPRLGWTTEKGTLVEWLKASGERVQIGEILFTVENDKALNEVEEGKTERAKLKKDFEGKQKKLDKKQKELLKLKEELEQLRGTNPATWLANRTLSIGLAPAIYDLVGKANEVPAYHLFGPRVRDWVPVSCWTVSQTPAKMAEEVEHAVEHGGSVRTRARRRRRFANGG